jgi:hypothetical protein
MPTFLKKWKKKKKSQGTQIGKKNSIVGKDKTIIRARLRCDTDVEIIRKKVKMATIII